MLTVEENETLTRVGSGTPMGKLMRFYWYPVAFSADLPVGHTRGIRLLGENFVMYRDQSGQLGMVDEKCPHRSVSMLYGIVEDCGLRCAYHGWLFDKEGNCVEQPAEPPASQFKDRVSIGAYPVQEMGGLLWTYIGEAPVPELPRFDVYVMDGVRDAGYATIPCNWLQIMENSVDPYHVEFLHGYYFEYLGNKEGFEAPKSFQKKHKAVAFEEMEFGIIKRRLLEGQSEEDDDWKIGHPLMFPYGMRVGGANIEQMQIRVPIDDTHTWIVFYATHNPGKNYPIDPENTVTKYELPWMKADGTILTDYVEGQDIMAWVTQGEICDRSIEHIGKSDLGAIKVRRLFKENLARVEQGIDPMGVVRYKHERIDLPCEKNKFGAGPKFAFQWLTMGSSKFSPQVDRLTKIHEDAHKELAAG
jgi:5,5'-dehydrodivanillate O-demethylase oxygenase subunit